MPRESYAREESGADSSGPTYVLRIERTRRYPHNRCEQQREEVIGSKEMEPSTYTRFAAASDETIRVDCEVVS